VSAQTKNIRYCEINKRHITRPCNNFYNIPNIALISCKPRSYGTHAKVIEPISAIVRELAKRSCIINFRHNREHRRQPRSISSCDVSYPNSFSHACTRFSYTGCSRILDLNFSKKLRTDFCGDFYRSHSFLIFNIEYFNN